MPKTKTKRPRKSKKKQGSSLGLYIFLGVVCAGLLWFLTKPDEKTVISREQASVTESYSRKPSSTQEVSQGQASKEQPTVNLDETLAEIARKLEVPEKSLRRRASDNKISYSIPIDPNTLDLNYVNVLIKTEVEKAGGELVTGTETSKSQKLSILHKASQKTYDLDIFYDEKTYSGRVPDKAIAIVVDDFGDIEGDLLDGFFALDKNICFAIMPDTPHGVTTMQRAHSQGRETLIHIPMEPVGYPKNNPGEKAIFVQHSPHEIEHRLTGFINELPNCIGANNHMGSLATADEGVMQVVMNVLRKNKLYFLDSRTTQVSVAYSVAQKTHIPAYRNDIFLDAPNLSQPTFDSKIDQILFISQERSQVVAITHCHTRNHLNYLSKMVSRLKAEGFKIVPLSKLGQHNVPPIS
ncbi:MAG: divergent polysaccharide deacetylase family protein [Candidatus Cloacimonetes bacterium]|nr:divergent polysaccharide deacetylase family protein [Candidatus Cloacimonadota bacterium]